MELYWTASELVASLFLWIEVYGTSNISDVSYSIGRGLCGNRIEYFNAEAILRLHTLKKVNVFMQKKEIINIYYN